ncbi:MAG: hypothetical protein AAFO95_16220 [Cyanobacteria bacterium J06600_6]
MATVNLPPAFSSEIPTSNDIDGLILPPVHPDVSAGEIYYHQFSVDSALGDAISIKDALNGFYELTRKVTSAFGESAVSHIDYTSLEIQTIGFPNWLNTLTGTIYKQNYQIKRLELQLAQKQFSDREIDRATLDTKKANYLQAKKDFQSFWRSFQVVD